MTKINKHYTLQEYMETFSSIQDMYDYYFEMQREIDKLSEYNMHLIKTINDYEELLLKSNNKLDKIKELITFYDNDGEVGASIEDEKELLKLLEETI